MRGLRLAAADLPGRGLHAAAEAFGKHVGRDTNKNVFRGTRPDVAYASDPPPGIVRRQSHDKLPKETRLCAILHAVVAQNDAQISCLRRVYRKTWTSDTALYPLARRADPTPPNTLTKQRVVSPRPRGCGEAGRKAFEALLASDAEDGSGEGLEGPETEERRQADAREAEALRREADEEARQRAEQLARLKQLAKEAQEKAEALARLAEEKRRAEEQRLAEEEQQRLEAEKQRLAKEERLREEAEAAKMAYEDEMAREARRAQEEFDRAAAAAAGAAATQHAAPPDGASNARSLNNPVCNKCSAEFARVQKTPCEPGMEPALGCKAPRSFVCTDRKICSEETKGFLYKAYRMAALRAHPDKSNQLSNPDERKAMEETFQVVKDCYSSLQRFWLDTVGRENTDKGDSSFLRCCELHAKHKCVFSTRPASCANNACDDDLVAVTGPGVALTMKDGVVTDVATPKFLTMDIVGRRVLEIHNTVGIDMVTGKNCAGNSVSVPCLLWRGG